MNRDRVLLKTLGFSAVFCISAGAMISSGIFILPGIAYAQIGPAVFLSYLLGGICALVGALSTIELATAMPLAGGIYYYTERSLGPLAGTISGLLNWAAIALKSSFAIYGMSAAVAGFCGWEQFSWHGIDALELFGVGFTLFFLCLNLIGTRSAAWAQIVMVALLLGVMVFYIVGMTPEFTPSRFHPFFLAGKGIRDLVANAAFIFVAFGGLLDVAGISEEVRNPQRNLPLGMIGAIVVVTVLYTLILLVSVGGMDAGALVETRTPLADAAAARFGGWGFALLTFGAMMAFVTTANAGIMAAARFPFALGRDQLIPSCFSRLYGKRNLPLPALLLTGSAIVVSLFLDLESLVQAASTVIMLSFVLTNLSVIILRESGLQNYRPSFRVPAYPWTPLLGMGIFSILIVRMGLESVQISLAIVMAGVLLYFVFGRKVKLEFALLHLVGRISRNRLDSHGLESELREIVRHRDGIVKDDFDETMETAGALIFDEPMTRNELFDEAALRLAPELGMRAYDLAERLRLREEDWSTTLAATVAVPHLMVEGSGVFRLMLVKCTGGVEFDSETAPAVHAVVFLFASPDQRRRHLLALAAIAQTIQSPNFDRRWERARSAPQLNDIFLLGKRRRTN